MGSPVVVASPRKSPLSGRRVNKPLVEKKRRARINGCLGQLKSLILTAMHTEQDAQVSRLEKADILEMTVNYLRQIQRQQVTTAVASQPDVVAKFSAGYTECATEVIRYMDSVKCVAPDVRSRLEHHLVDRLRSSVPADARDGCVPVPYNRGPAHPGIECPTRQVSSISSTTNDQMNKQHPTAVYLSDMASPASSKENLAHPAGSAAPRLPNQPRPQMRSAQAMPAMSSPKVQPPTPGGSICADLTPTRVLSPMTNTNNVRCLSNASDIIPTRSTTSPRLVSRLSTFGQTSFPPSSVDVSNLANRQLRECLKPALTCSSYTSANVKVENMEQNDVNNNIQNNNMIKRHLSNVQTFHSNFQRPLHIHIPDVPQSVTPSPPFLHSQERINAESSSSLTSTYSFDEGPPTILYGYPEYNMQAENTPSPEPAEASSSRLTPNEETMHFHGNLFTAIQGNNPSCPDRQQQAQIANRNFQHMDITHEPHAQTLQPGRRASPADRSFTPSPPTLLPEDSYNSQTSRHNNISYSNISRHVRPNSVEHHDYSSAGLNVEYNQMCAERQDSRNNQNLSQEFHQLKCTYSQPVSYSVHITPHTTNSVRECPSVPVTHSAPLNNGLPLTPRAPSRQNDTPLSPPTLKKRLLLAQGSEVEWTVPRCRGLTVDKRSHPLDSGPTECRQNHRLWQDAESRPIINRETHSVGPTVLFCTVPGHPILADDGLWRPW